MLIDGKRRGRTNVVIEIEAGSYTVSLVPPHDFTPPEIPLTLDPSQTSPLQPKEVTFDVA